jgi:hypothetical protein
LECDGWRGACAVRARPALGGFSLRLTELVGLGDFCQRALTPDKGTDEFLLLLLILLRVGPRRRHIGFS